VPERACPELNRLAALDLDLARPRGRRDADLVDPRRAGRVVVATGEKKKQECGGRETGARVHDGPPRQGMGGPVLDGSDRPDARPVPGAGWRCPYDLQNARPPDS